ncbi:hypothetical protein PZ937_19025 [Vibrio alginolyticus]|nr:hypothetical protein [Vibrio alginolyticus]
MSNKKIINNTLMLYIRQIILIGVNLYTIRVVLDVLGVDSYGVYTVVAGVVALFSFLTNSMAAATQRYFSYALGKNDVGLLYKTFTVNFVIYSIIAVFSLIFLQTFGFWFVENKLTVDVEFIDAAKILYQFSIFTLIATIMTSPFIAIIIAHEDMKIFAKVSIFEAILKLSVVFILGSIKENTLETYGLLLLCVSVLILSLYFSICMMNYRECQLKKWYWDYLLFKEVLSFTSWTLFGQFTSVLRNQSITILLNQFFSPAVVTSRAIATNIASQVNMFSSNFNTGLYPPIIKSYANNDKLQLANLLHGGSKLTFFLMWIFALPLIVEMELVLNIWLVETPEYLVLFTRLSLIESLIFSISLPLSTAARAPGKMKFYELVLGTMQISILLFSYVALKLGSDAYIVFLIAIIVNVAMFFVRLVIVSKLVGINIEQFLRKVLYPICILVALSLSVALSSKSIPCNQYVSGLITVTTSFISSTLIMYRYGLDAEWRMKVKSFMLKKIRANQ